MAIDSCMPVLRLVVATAVLVAGGVCASPMSVDEKVRGPVSRQPGHGRNDGGGGLFVAMRGPIQDHERMNSDGTTNN